MYSFLFNVNVPNLELKMNSVKEKNNDYWLNYNGKNIHKNDFIALILKNHIKDLKNF